MDGGVVVEIRVVGDIADIPAADWDACAAPEAAGGGRPDYPFLTHRFLLALEESGSATARTGWAPHHLVASIDGNVAGVMPLYLKSHSQGEYVFDHSWAHAFERAGGDYYPKLQASVPFTPATGPRLLARPDGPVSPEIARAALLRGAVQLAERHGISSVHITFCTEDEWRFGAEAGFLQRTDQQFHWMNRGYDSFDGFVEALASRKRKNLRKERAEAVAAGIEIEWVSGKDLREDHWDAFWRFYQDTGSRKWGRPYLNREFFRLAHQRFSEDILLVMARRQGRWIAGALNLVGRETLFGRYWGCVEEHPFLHFEVCYYQAIDYAIRHGMARVEAGAQGAHKLARGYEPVTTRSLHWITNPGFRRAIAQYLDSERDAVAWENAALAERTPFRKT